MAGLLADSVDTFAPPRRAVTASSFGNRPAVEVIGSARVLGRDLWGDLARDASLYGSYPWVRWCETVPDFSPAHLVLRCPAGQVIAVLPAFWWGGGGASPNSWYHPHRVFITPRHPPGERHSGWQPLLLLGSCAGYHSALLFRPGLTAEERAVAADELLMTARRLAREADAALAGMYVPDSATEFLAAAEHLKALRAATSAEAVIPVTAGGLDMFLAHLGAKRRRTVQRELREFAQAGHHVDELPLRDAWPVAGRLLGLLQRKYGESDSDDQMLSYLRSQVPFLDAISTVLVEYDGATPVGFALAYAHRGTVYLRAAGFTPGAARFAYFNVVVYRMVELAASRGLKEINLGTGAYPGKCARGARLDPLWSVLWPPSDLSPEQRAMLELPGPEAIDAQVATGGRCFPKLPALGAAGLAEPSCW
jgi:uncharacterized protein